MDQKMKRGLLDPAVWSVGALLSDCEISAVRGGTQTNQQAQETDPDDFP